MNENKYKLFMFGFGIELKSLDDVEKRLSQIPTNRAEVEGIDQCYLIDLKTGEKYQINFDKKKYFVKFK
ncbi:hypothetical protein CCY99_01340 [Helicobacter sp. 16-1353]|uniref:hypothetical protein n=1 Tax=Helicobacter sp. 16-1353 TaxID=2004996 RepID=UPI000DCC19A6|nr:hypothetical protein [Helicobacter sp. 16-1353]RAX55368.1 hypothetical protein CCY99_01340 [Helicobacter sp. 16-1353]